MVYLCIILSGIYICSNIFLDFLTFLLLVKVLIMSIKGKVHKVIS